MQQQSNPYYVEPMNLLPGIQDLQSGMQSQAKQRIRQSAIEKFKSGDLEGMSELVLKHPWLKDDITAMTGVKDDQEKSMMSGIARNALIGNMQPLFDKASQLNESGKDSSPFLKMIYMAEENPKEFKKNMEQMYALFDTDNFLKYKKGLEGGSTGQRYIKGNSWTIKDEEGKESSMMQIFDRQTGESFNVEAEFPKGKKTTVGGQTADEKFIDEILAEAMKQGIKGKAELQNFIDQMIAKRKYEPQIEQNIARKKAEEERAQKEINESITASNQLPDLRRALSLMDNIKTGGLHEMIRIAKRYFNFTEEPANEGELSYILSKRVLAQLRPTLGSQFTENDRKRLENIESGFGTDTATNKALLRQAIGITERATRNAIKTAKKRNDEEAISKLNDNLEFVYDFSKDLDLSKPPSIRTNKEPQIKTEEVIKPTIKIPEKDEMKKLEDAMKIIFPQGNQ